MNDDTTSATSRLNVKKQTLDDMYAVPANFLEIDVCIFRVENFKLIISLSINIKCM